MSGIRGGNAHLDSNMQPKIAYLAPEIPALSATFVYEELLGVEQRGAVVVPISVRPPTSLAADQQALAKRTLILYEGSKLALALGGVFGLATFGRPALKALGWLISDMAEVGLGRIQSWKLCFQFLAAVKLARLLRRRGCCHLHVHFAHTPTQIAMYASALAGIPFTAMAHANDIFERGLLLPRKALRAKKLLTISEHNRRYLEQLGVASGKLAVVRCGVSFAAAPVLPKPSFRSRYRIGTLGRLVEKKGMDVLLRAIAELRQKPYAIELAVAGDGPMHAELAALAASLGLGEIVRFEGSLSHSQVATWMRSLDLFVLACKADSNGDMDGIPVVLMEAMSQSIPVVSTRLSGIPELIRHEETGLLAQPGDPLDLANQIDRLLAFPELRQRLAVHAVAHVEAEFGRNVNLDRLLECFDLGGKPTICQTM